MNRQLRFTLPLAALLFIPLSAGPNEHARVSIDYDFRTPAVETSLTAAASGDSCLVGVYIEGAVDVNSYSIKLQFDSATVRFCDASIKNSFSERPFIESAGGQALMLSHSDWNTAELAVTLKGNAVSVAGNGNIGYFVFRRISEGEPALSIGEVRLVNRQSVIDVVR